MIKIIFTIKFYKMKNIIKYSATCWMLLLITKCCNAQQYNNSYRTTDAVMVGINGASQIEDRLSGAVVALFTNLHLLNIRLNTPFNSITDPPGINSMLYPGLSFDLKVKVDPNQIQTCLTSARVFTAQGSLTINGITQPVNIQYMPLPSGTEQNGDFNISMNIQFDPREFDLREPYNNSQFVIKISDATVNRV